MAMTDLPTAFAIWAAVVALIGAAIVWELARLRQEFKEMRTDFHSELKELRTMFTNSSINTEGRTTHIESHLRTKDGTFQPWRGGL
jgi:hypothetical protein